MDIVCLSHLRWDFVFQRPQHLLSRAARDGRVFYVEEPVFEDGPTRLRISGRDSGVQVVVPVLPHGSTADEQVDQQRRLVAALRSEERRVGKGGRARGGAEQGG